MKSQQLIKIDFKKPNVEAIKAKANLDECTSHIEILTFDELQSKTGVAWVSVESGYVKQLSELTRQEPRADSEIYYELVNGTMAYEFYYELTQCEARSQICQGKIQSRVYTNKWDNENNCVVFSCSACHGTLFNNEPVNFEQVELEEPGFNSWYSASRPIKVLSWGVGMDSTMLVMKYGMEADIILFSDTGAEEMETYAYLQYIMPKLPRRIREKIVVLENHKMGAIDEWYFDNKMQPMPFADRQCTDKWKVRLIKNYLRRVFGEKAVFEMMVGINYDEQLERERPLPTDAQLESHINGTLKYDTKKLLTLSKKAKVSVEDYKERLRNALQTGTFNKQGEFVPGLQYLRNVYPLCDNKVGKQQEEDFYKEEGIMIPPKSGCYFCPMKSKAEWNRTATEQPEMYENAKAISNNSRAKIDMMEMSTIKATEMRCSCNNGIYPEEDIEIETISDTYTPKKASGRGI